VEDGNLDTQPDAKNVSVVGLYRLQSDHLLPQINDSIAVRDHEKAADPSTVTLRGDKATGYLGIQKDSKFINNERSNFIVELKNDLRRIVAADTGSTTELLSAKFKNIVKKSEDERKWKKDATNISGKPNGLSYEKMMYELDSRMLRK